MPTLVRQSTSAFRKLAALLRRDFDSADSGYSSHGIHPFAAKFPPQIPRLFIEELTESGDSVSDPMAGSGTTVVEALMLKREAFGFDIDPQELGKKGVEIIEGASTASNSEHLLRRELQIRFDQETGEFLEAISKPSVAH